MRISIITDVLNASDTIAETINNVLSQTYRNIEYIVVDGHSRDGTVEIVERYRDELAAFVSEPDNNHFEAMNKGLDLATGEVIGFLHADDVFADNAVISDVAGAFSEGDVDCLWGDLVYVSNADPSKVVRYWRSCPYRPNLFKRGWMPPHPTFFARRNVYRQYGYFNTSFPISADYELMLRFLHKHRITTHYLPRVLVKMRLGGLSNRSVRNILQKSVEDCRAWRVNRLQGGIPTVLMKNVSKIPQFFVREKLSAAR